MLCYRSTSLISVQYNPSLLVGLNEGLVRGCLKSQLVAKGLGNEVAVEAAVAAPAAAAQWASAGRARRPRWSAALQTGMGGVGGAGRGGAARSCGRGRVFRCGGGPRPRLAPAPPLPPLPPPPPRARRLRSADSNCRNTNLAVISTAPGLGPRVLTTVLIPWSPRPHAASRGRAARPRPARSRSIWANESLQGLFLAPSAPGLFAWTRGSRLRGGAGRGGAGRGGGGAGAGGRVAAAEHLIRKRLSARRVNHSASGAAPPPRPAMPLRAASNPAPPPPPRPRARPPPPPRAASRRQIPGLGRRL